MFVDVHCHIDQYSEIEKVNMSRVKAVVGAAMDCFSGEKILSLAKERENIHACLGIHPEYSDYYGQIDTVEKQIYENRDRMVAVGEVGLPYYCMQDKSENEKQSVYSKALCILERFVKISKELKKPLVLHAIEDTAYDALRLLDEYGIESALFHWFEGDEKALEMIVERGYYVSVSPDVMYNKRYDEFVKKVPIENMVFESDGPWEYEGKSGMPDMVLDIAKHIGRQRDIPVKDIEKIAYENSCRLFGIKL